MIISDLNPEDTLNYLKIGVGKHKRHILISDIIYCKADVNYTHIFIKDNTKCVISKTLKVYAKLLSPSFFFRIHASYIVNTSEVVSFQKDEFIVTLKNGVQLPLAHRKKTEFKLMLKKQNTICAMI